MASSSTTSIHKTFKYDLFMSFRGEDTRKNFVDHLYVALQRQGIHTFKDDKRLEKGKKIDKQLIKAIKDSKLFIIVLSKTYASSSWCLNELVKIIKCQKTTEQTAYPVFYDVEPKEVRKNSGAFGDAFAKHKFEKSFEKWKKALKEAADLAGWELKKTADGHEVELIKEIVEEISLKLRSISFSVDEKLVGMESRIKDVEVLLEIGFDDVRMIGIKGMGGGGKTTLARAVFDKISRHFEYKSFVENVREVSQTSLTGLKSLQKEVLSNVLNDKDINVNSVYDGKNMMKKMLSRRKVLLVLDDVDHIQQLEALAGEPSWFMEGSRIIITTRDEQVLLSHRVNRIHGVNLLSDDEAYCLFSRYAFGRDTPIRGYDDLSLKVVSYVAGLPLTIKVLGSFLCGKHELEWKDALERLETIPEKETTQILELSYMGLEDDYKEIFLNVVCFMEAWMKDDVIQALECCGFHARTGLKILEQKSLITIFQDDFGLESISVHDLIKEMGRNIVRRVNPNEPSTHSRLWISEEIENILANGLGSEATKYINLGWVEFVPRIFTKGFSNMKKLIFLNISVNVNFYFSHDRTDLKDGIPFEDGSSSNYINFDQARQYFPNSLRYLRWDGYHHRCFPKSFQPNNLVALRMRDSRITLLWEEGESKVVKKLKFLDFTDSMLRNFNLEMTPNLERLDLTGCYYLEKLITPFGCHLKLKSLYVSQSKLMTLDLRMAQNLETLDLHACHDLVKLYLPVKCLKLTSVNISCLSKLREINLGSAPNLEKFYLVQCHDLLEFRMPVGCLKLRYLTLHLSTLTTLDIGLNPKLEKLCLENCHNLVEFQALVNTCEKLTCLQIINSDLKTLNLRVAKNLEELYLEKCHDLVEIYMPVSCQKLRSIDLNLSKLRTLRLGLSPSLENLRLAQCQDLLELQIRIGCPALTYIDISNSKLCTIDLGMTLVTLSITQCYDLVEFRMPNGCPNLRNLYLRHSKLRTLDLRLTPNLRELVLKECDELVELQMPIKGCPKLRNLYLQQLKLRTLDLQLTPNLDRLHLEECDVLVELHMPVYRCSITYLYFRHVKLKSTLDLRFTPNLNELNLQECDGLMEIHMPNGGSKLTKVYLRHLKLRTLNLRLTPDLQILDIEDCHDLVQLHMPVSCLKLTLVNLRHSMLRHLDLVMAPNLKKLHIEECHDMLQHNAPIQCVKGLKCIDLSGRSRLKYFVLYKMWGSHAFHLSAESIDICPLDTNHSLPKFQFSCLFEEQEQLPSTTINLQKLVSLANCCIRNFPTFSECICGLQSLRRLKLHGSIPEMPKHLEQLEYLEVLVLSSIETKHLPHSICMLKHLKSLKLKSCSLLEKLPEDIGRLECLEVLIIKECPSLRDIPISICKMKRLKEFSLAFCTRVEKLPEELGALECLKELNVEGTGISRLPNSISLLKGRLRVVGSASLLQSCGFASPIDESDESYDSYESFATYDTE